MKWYKNPLLPATALLLWLTALLAAYYVFHKPFTLANATAVASAAAGLLGAGLVVALGTGVGLVLLRRLDLSPAERLPWAAATGLDLVALAGLGLGAVGLLRPWLLWLLTFGGLAATARPLARALRALWSDPSWRPVGRFETFLAGYCSLALAIALAWALTPPTAWDGLVYHLTGPRLYLATGRISHPLDLPYLGFPQLVELLFTWGMGLTGERAAAAIHWFYAVIAVGALVGAGGRRGYVAAAVLLSAPSLVLLAGWPYVDLAQLLYTTLAFLALMRHASSPPPVPPRLWGGPWLLLSGVMAGLALSTKYTALAVLPALGLVQIANCRLQIADSKLQIARSRMCNLQSAICNLLFPCTTALLLWSPWLVKNLLLTGNPTYPFFFGGRYWDSWRAWWFDRPGTGLLYTAPWRLLLAPWELTVRGVEGLGGYGATVGPLLLALLPLLLLVRQRLTAEERGWLRAAFLFCAVVYGFWLWGVARSALLLQGRLLFPIFGLLALAAGLALERLRVYPRRPLNAEWLTKAIMVCVLALTLLGLLLSIVNERPLPVLLGYESREDFLARRLGMYHLAIQAVNELPDDAVVLFLWEPRAYPCRMACRPDALLDRFLHATHLHGSDGPAIAAEWRAEGVTHLLLNRAGMDFVHQERFDPLTDQDVATLEALLQVEAREVQSFGSAYTLYRLEGP
jgi:hypothetical protein